MIWLSLTAAARGVQSKKGKKKEKGSWKPTAPWRPLKETHMPKGLEAFMRLEEL